MGKLDSILNSFIKYVNNENIIFKEWNTFNFDILIYAIENEASEELIKYIIDQYDTLDYTIVKLKKECKNSYPDVNYISPLAAALIKNNYDIANLLLKKGADINYRENDFNLYDKISMDYEKLKFLFENGYKVNSDKDNENIIKLLLDIQESNDLKYYLQYMLEKNGKINIYDSYYEYLLKDRYNIREENNYYIFDPHIDLYRIGINRYFIKDSMDKTLILYNYDQRDDKFKIIYKMKDIFEYDLGQRDNNIYKEINKKLDIFIKLKRDIEIIDKYYDEEIKQNIIEFDNFIISRKINLKDLKINYNFDILIQVIENNYSKEVIEHILDQTKYKSFNYVVNNKSPLYSAISKEKYDIADLLINKGADINFIENVESSLSQEGIEYILKKGFDLKNKSFILINYINFKKNMEDDNMKDIYDLINDLLYDKTLIKYLLTELYGHKKQLSKIKFREVFSNFVKKIINDEIYENAIKNKDKYSYNIILKYEVDNKKRNKFEIEYNYGNNNDNNDYYYYDSEDDVYDYD